MKKTFILIILFTVIILGITAGIYIFISNENKKTENNNVEDVINKVSDKVQKDYTRELNELNKLDNSLETNSNEEKISPNCLVILKRHYDKCGHTTNEYIDIQENLVNKTQDELEEKYPNWEVEKFSSGEIILYKEYTGICDEHYILREKDGKIVIYKIDENGQEKLYETTEIAIDYLTDEDKENIKINVPNINKSLFSVNVPEGIKTEIAYIQNNNYLAIVFENKTNENISSGKLKVVIGNKEIEKRLELLPIGKKAIFKIAVPNELKDTINKSKVTITLTEIKSSNNFSFIDVDKINNTKTNVSVIENDTNINISGINKTGKDLNALIGFVVLYNNNKIIGADNIRIENIKNNKYLYAFILGKSSYIDIESYNNYKINGVTHLFALSGLHVSLFSSIVLYILNKLKLNEKVTFTITSIFLITFSFIASFTPSILRATIFFILSSVNKIYYFFIKPKNLLYLTFAILIFINPFYIFDTGFILSFTITYFILLMNEKITIEGNIKSILIVSMLSFLSSLPIIINLSYEINIIGFINNIFFIPLVTNIIFPLSLIVILIPKLSFILFILTRVMEKVSAFSSSILNITLYFQRLSYIEIFIYYVLLILSIKKNKKVLILLLIFVFILYIKPNFNKNTYVYFIDVGQGDSALIITKNNKSILIDTGGKLSYKVESWKQKNKEYNLMSLSIIPFFKSIGLKKIDYLLITHGDADHAGYALELLDNFKIINKYTNKGRKNTLEKKLNINSLEESYLKIDNIEIYSLNNNIYNNENKDSLVLLIKIYNNKFLFMADADKEVEKSIIEKYNLKDIDFLKVGHHGSKTSTDMTFINKINPKYSIISVGKNNKFGHPNKEVLNNLSDSKIYRTDQDGSIMLKIKKNKLRIETYSP